ncbi:MAG: acyl-ACP--UDP-N-acetylglucosamine O-acyltransferase, partial [Planctomycetota bacterium]
NNVTILGHTTIGSDNVFFPNAVIGADPQDLKFRGEDARLVIGDNNHFRENCTIHIGTATGSGETRIGSGNLLMVNCHVGHDAVIGDGCVLANNVMLAGHVHIGDRVSMMGGSALHHFASVGDFAFVAGYAQITHDVPPYVKVDMENHVRAVNVIGLRRGNAMSDQDIAALEVAIKRLFISKKQPMSVKIAEMLADEQLNPFVREVVDSVRRRALGKHGRYLEGSRKA